MVVIDMGTTYASAVHRMLPHLPVTEGLALGGAYVYIRSAMVSLPCGVVLFGGQLCHANAARLGRAFSLGSLLVLTAFLLLLSGWYVA